MKLTHLPRVKRTTLPLLREGIAVQAGDRVCHLLQVVSPPPILRADGQKGPRLSSTHNPAFLFNRKVDQGQAQDSTVSNFL